MKRIVLLIMIAILCLSGCSEGGSVETGSDTKKLLSERYTIGDEINLAGVLFNVYKINNDNNELYLMAQNNVATTVFSDDEREQKYVHDYEGSLVEGQVNKFVDSLEDMGIVVKASRIIDKDDLIELGFETDGLNGTKYKIESIPDYLQKEEHFWVDGYCRYDTYAWVYCNGILTTQPCEEEYGVRPIIVIDANEVDKPTKLVDENLTIKEVVNTESAWSSEGGIANPYDLFYFDCENMLFTNVFESTELSDVREFNMRFVDEKTIQTDGVMRGYEIPAEITVVDENKLKLRFVDDKYNDGDYYLNRTEND